MKNNVFLAMKKILRRAGYDVKYHHAHYDTLLKKYAIKTVLDIGANNGQFARDLFEHFPTAILHSFEPLKDCYDELVKAMERHQEFYAYNIGLSDTEAELEMHRSAFSPSSSLRPMAELHKEMYPKSVETRNEKIKVRRLDDWARDVSLQTPLMVKIDVQGYEDKVIAGGQETLKKASIILIETSFKTLYEGQPLFDDIYESLKALGFSYYGNNGQHWKGQELVYEDSFFVKE